MEACGLRALQFHGDEKPEDLADYALPVIKTIKLPPAKAMAGFLEGRTDDFARWRPTSRCAAAILLDSAERWSEGGARHPIEWHLARRLRAGGCRLILSGGLTPDNVAAAVETVGPLRGGRRLRRGGHARPEGSRQGAALRQPRPSGAVFL